MAESRFGPTEQQMIRDGLIICRQTHASHPFGVFYGENPLHFSFPLTLLEVTFVIIITRIVRWLLQPLKQPRVVSEIIGGIMIGPSVLGRNKKFTHYLFPENATFLLKNIAVIGFMYFLFLTGVKMDLTSVKRAGKKQWYIALYGVVIPISCVIIVACLIHNSLRDEMHKASSIWGVSAALAITSFPVIYPIVRDLNLLSSDMGRMALSTAVIGDIIGINGVVAFEAAKQGEAKPIAALWYLISLVIVAISIIGGLHQVMLWIVRITPEGKPVEQVYIVGILVGVLVSGFVTDATGLAIANGSLWLGLVVPDGPPLGSTLVGKSETFVMEVLMPFSYAYVGMIFDFHSMKEKWPEMQPLFYMALTGYLSKFLATFVVTRYFSMPFKDGLALSLILSVRGQLEILLFMHWMDLKMIGQPDFTMMVLLTVCVTAVATPIISIVYDPTKPYMINKTRDIQHNPPNTRLHIVICIHDQESLPGFINLLEVSSPTLSSPFSVYALHLVDLVGRALPVLIDHSKEDEEICEDKEQEHSNHCSIHNAMQQFEEGMSELIKIYPFTAMTPQKSMYHDICELALVKKASLIILPFKKDCLDNSAATEIVSNSVLSVNLAVLAHAPCSVGVFVDKDSFRLAATANVLSMSRPSHHLAVLFLGGADSREALAYADRMAGNTDVSLTVIRFLAHNGEGDDQLEKKLDDGLVTWFWVKNEGNNQVLYKEVVVRNGDETVAAIQAMNNESYDLWIVGRKHGINPLLVQGLDHWSPNLELGVIGDYVASMDLGSRASVLVIQQQVLRDKEMESGGLTGRFSRCIKEQLLFDTTN